MSGTRAQRTGCAWIAMILCASAGCSAARPLLLWRHPEIRGQARLVDPGGAPLPGVTPAGVTLNFIHRGGRIENSLLSVATDDAGRYCSPALPPGDYTVEAQLAGFAIESQSIEVRSHEHRRVDFVLKKIRENSGRSQRESREENIPHPGEVQILPPPF